MNSFAGIFQGLYVDFKLLFITFLTLKNISVSEHLTMAASVAIYRKYSEK